MKIENRNWITDKPNNRIMEQYIKVKILSVNVSKKTGTVKKPVEFIRVTDEGIKGDAHAGDWHRQISVLAQESVDRFSKKAGRGIGYGEFAENITTEGLELKDCSVFDRFESPDIVLEVTQIGKKCHGDDCAIYRETGNCVMPKEGIFCRVVKKGVVKPGDTLKYVPKVFRILVITLSDRASRGEYKDRSGPEIVKIAKEFFKNINKDCQVLPLVIPDNEKQLRNIMETSIKDEVDFIITTGGTGIGAKDITVETVKPLLDKEIPGIMEMIRMKYGQEKPNALISRGVAGVAGKSLVFTLPGSVNAVREYMEEITKVAEHLIYMLHEIDVH